MSSTGNTPSPALPSGRYRQMLRGLLAGLVPTFIAIPLFMLGFWGLGISISLSVSLFSIVMHLFRHKPITGVDLSTLALLAIVAIGYFVFHNTFFILHFGVVIYSILLIQVIYGEIRRQSFTAQYSKQMYSSELWSKRSFIEGNRFLSRVWGTIFGVSILIGVFGTSTLMLMVLPNMLIVIGFIIGPSIGHWYGTRFLAKGQGIRNEVDKHQEHEG